MAVEDVIPPIDVPTDGMISDAELAAREQAIQDALDQDAVERDEERDRIRLEIEQRNQDAQDVVIPPQPEVELPDSIDVPAAAVDPIPLPDGHQTEPPYYEPGPGYPIIEYPAEPGA